MILICLDIFRDDKRLYPSKSNQFSNKKFILIPENMKLIKKLLVIGANPGLLWKKRVTILAILQVNNYFF